MIPTPRNVILIGHVIDRLREIPDDSVHCVVTSPPYWNLRDYGTDAQVWGGDSSHDHEWGNAVPGDKRNGSTNQGGRQLAGGAPAGDNQAASRGAARGNYCACGAWRGELGLEPTPDEFVDHLVLVFREIHRVLHPTGTVWMNIGDSYAGSFGAQGREKGNDPKKAGKWNRGNNAQAPRDRRGGTPPGSDLKPKDLVGIPWMAAFALRRDGWWLRCDVIWNKPNPMPESTADRPTRSHEYLFLLTKSDRYFYDDDAIKEPFAESSLTRYSLAESRLAPAATLASWGAEVTDGPEKAYKGGQGRVAQREGVDGRDGLVVGGPGRKKFPAVPSAGGRPQGLPSGETPHLGGRRQAPQPGEPDAFGAVRPQLARAIELAKASNLTHAHLAVGRKKRSVWTIPTQPFREAHFATFPEDLVEPCVLAGTSAYGSCSACGSPWARQTETTMGPIGEIYSGKGRKDYEDNGVQNPSEVKRRVLDAMRKSKTTAGWQPTCSCEGAGVVPCLVLDPFFGSGTTGLVARRLGRDWLGTELNESYAAIARRRLAPVMNERITAFGG